MSAIGPLSVSSPIDVKLMNDIQDKLEQLHDSRRRASQRGDEDEERGVFQADGAREYDDLSEFERRPEHEAGDETSEPTRRLGGHVVSTAYGPAPYLEYYYSPDDTYGDITLGEARAVDLGELFERLALSDGSLPSVPDVLYLDTETTGLSEEDFAFCVGLGGWEEDDFRIRHYVFDSLESEEALLAAVADRVRAHDLLCTFNGRRFDVPLLRRRYDHREMPSPFESIHHFDVLRASRKTHPNLESHSLTSMETHSLGLERTDDLPGQEVPRRWESFQETGDPELLEDVFEHNRGDILAMVALNGVFGDAPTSTAREVRSESNDGPLASMDDEGATPESAETNRSPSSDDQDASQTTEPTGRDVSNRLERARRMRSDADRSSRSARSIPSSDGGSPSSTASRSDGGSTAERPSDSMPPSHRSQDALKEGADADEPEMTRQEWLKRLRQKASQRIEDDGLTEALPLLHEIAALAPRHAFALERLAEYHRQHGSDTLADHYARRLDEASPF